MKLADRPWVPKLREGKGFVVFIGGLWIALFSLPLIASMATIPSMMGERVGQTGLKISLPHGTKKVIINIGSNVDPIVPRKGDFSTHALAFEPIVSDIIHPHPQLTVIPAAVSDASGLQTMRVYNEGGVSSSLAKPASTQHWNNVPKRDGLEKIVPILSFQDVLDSIPLDIEIAFIKTDMQGFDFKAVSSVGKALVSRGVKRLLTEVYLENTNTYEGVENDFCLHWIQYMTSVGYAIRQLGSVSGSDAVSQCQTFHNQTSGLRETDAYWRLSSATEEDDDISNYLFPRVLTSVKKDRSSWKTISVYIGNSTYGVTQDWYSQVGQDKTVCGIFELLHGDCNGRFFLDLASNDAASLSNSKALEDHFDWTGICIEANFEYTWGLAHRKCDIYYAIVSEKTGDIVEFIEHPEGRDGAFGGIVSEHTDNRKTANGTKIVREASSLLEILQRARAPKVIDYFSFDVEGAEDTILQPVVLEEFKFLVITVERPSKALQATLQTFDYVYIRDHGGFGDKMYVHSSLGDIEKVKSKFGT
ncbi:hypothetical protein M9435_005155 [Picochlorum sp. BPE23]|nr:hypothetical protein M9435_005155 [Picochlorum sp. BPE23]